MCLDAFSYPLVSPSATHKSQPGADFPSLFHCVLTSLLESVHPSVRPSIHPPKTIPNGPVFGPFSTFYAPPWTTPHPLWPEFVPPHPLSPTNLKMILRIKIIYDFWIFLVKLSFLPFLSILAPKDPLLRAGLRKWGLLEAF